MVDSKSPFDGASCQRDSASEGDMPALREDVGDPRVFDIRGPVDLARLGIDVEWVYLVEGQGSDDMSLRVDQPHVGAFSILARFVGRDGQRERDRK
jgi:hypothetical protein